jgi:transcriptional regulator GlxA family with amidase domain
MWLSGKNDEYPAPVTMRRDKDFLRSLDQSVSLHYADKDFDLTKLSTELSLSKRQVQRRLKALAGRTPSEYLRSYRLRRSLEFLQQGMQVGQVTRAVGFSSQAYFASCFKAEFDQTPSEYQRRKI